MFATVWMTTIYLLTKLNLKQYLAVPGPRFKVNERSNLTKLLPLGIYNVWHFAFLSIIRLPHTISSEIQRVQLSFMGVKQTHGSSVLRVLFQALFRDFL